MPRKAARTLIANLDAEETWRRRLRPDLPAGPLPRAVLDRISAFGTLLRVYARTEKDVLVLPRRIDAERLTDVLPRPQITTADDRRTGGGELANADVVRWAVTAGRAGRIAARVNHRAFTLALQRRLGLVLPGTSWVTDEERIPSAIDSVLAAGTTGWVAKAPLSTAGRDRVIGDGTPSANPSDRLRRLLRAGGGLVVEPWLPRVDDIGALLDVEDTGPVFLGLHLQRVGDHGRFRGIDLGDLHLTTRLPTDQAERLESVACDVGTVLHRVGYRGPAGVDAWTWHRADGVGKGVALHPLGEINARLSFGRIARDLASRLGRSQLSLRLGNARDLPEDAEPLLRPENEKVGSAAWIESSESAGAT